MADTTAVPVHEHVALQEEEEFIEKVQGSSATEVAEGATETKHHDVSGSQVPGSQFTDEAGPQDGSADKHSAAPHAAGEVAGSSATEVAQSSAEGATETKHHDVSGSQVPGSQLTDEAGPQDGSADKHSAAPHAEVAGNSATEVAQSSAEGATETKHHDASGSQVPGSQLTDEAGPQDGSADKHSAAPHAEVAGSSATEVAQSSAEEASKEENDKDQISGMVETQSDGIAAIPTQQGVEDVQAPGVPLAGESEHLEETLLEALEKKNEENEENDTAEASESGAPKYRFGWWRLSRVAPEPDFEVRHVVHYKDGVQMGPARLERRRQRSGYQQTSTVPTLTPHYNPTGDVYQDWQWQRLVDLVSCPCEPPQLSGCVHVSYSTANAAVQDLSLAGGSGAPIIVSRIAPEGPARRAGVLPGFKLMALNGRDFSKGPWLETPAEQLLPLLPADAKVHLDLLDPAPQGHGLATLADKVARMPLLRPFFR